MSSAHSDTCLATCTNLQCSKAIAQESLEFYAGPGEYCPECGEALAPEPARTPPAPILTRPRRLRLMTPLRWFWLFAAIAVAGGAIAYTQRRAAATTPPASQTVTVCPLPGSQQLAVDLVRGYAAKSGERAAHFVVGSADRCDVRFSTAAENPRAVIARDGIVAIVNPLNPLARLSERQLRAIFSGSIRDWSQLGGKRGRIIAIMPAAGSDEAQVLATTLFYDGSVDGGVRRMPTSADVTRAVTGADRASRSSIGMVAFSQAVPGKVIQIAYLPAPSVLSIATRRYPYTLTIAVEPGSPNDAPGAIGLVNYARSSDGAAIVARSGLISREGM